MIRSLLSNLRVRFLFLVLLAVLPALGLLILTASEQRDQAVEIERENAETLAKLAAADQGRLIEGTRQLLIVLAGLPEVQTAGPACDQVLGEYVRDFPLYANLGVISPAGEVTCSGDPALQNASLADRDDLRGVAASGEFTVGEYQTGSLPGIGLLNAGYPVFAEDRTVISVVFAALDPANFGQFAAASELSPESIVTVFDRNGTVLVRRPQDDVGVGQSLVGDPIVDAILRQGSGVIEGRIAERNYVVAFETLVGESAGSAYVSIAIPKSEILARPEADFSRNLTRLGLVVLVVLVAAWVGGDLLGRRNADTHKELVRRIYDAFTTGGVDPLDDVVDQGFVDHDPMPGQAPGLPGLKQAVGLFRAAFPDGEMVVNELVAEGDKVVARVTLHGTHTGDYFGRRGTGRLVVADGIEIFRVSGDKVCEGWSRFVLPADSVAEPPLDAEGTMSPLEDPNGITIAALDLPEEAPSKHTSLVRDT